MKRFLVFLFFLHLFPTNIFAQEISCGTHFSEENLAHLKEVIKTIALPQQKDNSLNCVPIRYHIVRSDEGNSVVTQESVLWSLTTMNRQYRDAGLSFYLIEPPIFYDDSDYLALSNTVTEDDIRGLFDSPQNAVHFYVLDDLNGPGGFAYYPSPTAYSNAIFVLSNSVAGSVGGTIDHELGHYFSLPHTFEGTENGNTDPNAENVARTGADSNCETAADSFCDTEADPGNNGFVINCIYTGNEMDLTGTVYDPPLENPMSYHPPQCKSYMTQEQYTAIEQGYVFRQNQTEYHLDGPGLTVQPPTNLSYSVEDNGDVSLTFTDNADNEYGYLLEVSLEGPDNFNSVPFNFVVEDVTEFTYSNYDPANSYWFRVKPATGDCNTYSNTVFIPGNLSLDADGSSGAEIPNFDAGTLCGQGELSITDEDVLLLGSVDGIEINLNLEGIKDDGMEWLEAEPLAGLTIEGNQSSFITASVSGALSNVEVGNWMRGLIYRHNGEEVTPGNRTVRIWISSAGTDGDIVETYISVDHKYNAGSGGILSACPENGPNWSTLLPEDADAGKWYNESGEELFGSFSFSDLAGEYTFSAGEGECSVNAEYEISETEAPEWELFYSHPECETRCNGLLDISTSDGFSVFVNEKLYFEAADDLCEGEYDVLITNGSGCNRSELVNLTFEFVPSISFPNPLCTGEKVVLSDYLDLPTGTSAWLNENPIPYNSPVFIQPADTHELRFLNVEGCIDRVINFTSENCPTPNSTHFFIPNAFSPDGDGINDLFKPISAFEFEFYELTIVDRLGSIVFQTDQIESGWNGGGHESSEYYLPNSLFNYRIKYKLPSELDYRELRGSFVILR